MRHPKRPSAQGICLSLGALALALSLSVSAKQSSVKSSRGVQLRMSGALGEAANEVKAAAKLKKTGSRSSRAARAAYSSGAQGVNLELSSAMVIDDNIFRTTANEKPDVIIKTEPKLYLNGRMGKHRFRLGYEGKIGRYQVFRSENYFDHKILSGIQFDLDRRLKASLKSSIEYGHDSRGDVSSRLNSSANPDRWHRHDLSGDIVLGRRIAKAQIGLEFSMNGTRYTTNDQGLRDFDEKKLRLYGRYNLSTRLALLSEITGSWSDYLNPASDQSERKFTPMGGFAWEGAGNTSGEFKLGLRYEDFNTIGNASTKGLVWNGRINWSPRSYSRFTAYTSREVSTSARQGSGGTTSTDTFGLKWRHGLTRKFKFNAGFERSMAGISDASTDRLFNIQTGINYQINRWLNLKANWKFSSLSSTDGLAEYESNTVFIGLVAKFNHRLRKNYQ